MQTDTSKQQSVKALFSETNSKRLKVGMLIVFIDSLAL